MNAHTERVLAEAAAERVSQDARWGRQDLPFHDPVGTPLQRDVYSDWSVYFKRSCDERRKTMEAGGPDNRCNALVLLEEVFEALAEDDPQRIREELVQVAAVAVKTIEALDRAAGSDRVPSDRLAELLHRWHNRDGQTPVTEIRDEVAQYQNDLDRRVNDHG